MTVKGTREIQVTMATATAEPMDVDTVPPEETEDELILRIPIKSGASGPSETNFVEIFPEEISNIAASKLVQVLKDETSDVGTWADAGLLFMQQKQARQSLSVLEEACDMEDILNDKQDKVRILAATGIAHLAAANLASGGSSGSDRKGKRNDNDPKYELRQQADDKFTKASKIDTFFPMTWIGRGMLNLEKKQFDQARFFFQTTEKQCGPVLPALLGMAAVLFAEKDYKGAQAKYANAIRQYPEQSGAAARVGFGLSCYKLGQIDRAKAAFQRALDMDPESVEAMVSTAVLDLGSVDHSSGELASRTEKAIKLMSMANLIDHSNAMVQNHLANHYFWKWTQEIGTVSVTQGSTIIEAKNLALDPSERIRIGTQFETTIVDEIEDEGEGDNGNSEISKYKIQDAWTEESSTDLKVWKKDYDRVIALAKGAYTSTQVDAMRAESLFFLARVYHVRQEMDNAHKFYNQACVLAQQATGEECSLPPARFGLAQTFIVQQKYNEAIRELKKVLAVSSSATDALALLGLLLVREPKTLPEGLVQLQKAIELDPLNPQWVILEALALQQHEANYTKALDRYKKAIRLLLAKNAASKTKKQLQQQKEGTVIPYNLYANCGVLCHKTNKHEESLEMYQKALQALVATTTNSEAGGVPFDQATMDNKGTDGGRVRNKDNSIFFAYLPANIRVSQESKAREDDADPDVAMEDEEAESKRKRRWKIISKAEDSPTLEIGDHVQLGQSFESEIILVETGADGSMELELKDEYVADENKEPSEGEAKDGVVEFDVGVKRENRILDMPKALTIAFNIARLHEAAGRTLAAIELHKAILKRNPAYVNSLLCLACISVDCGALQQSSKWLKLAAQTAPGNPEVLTLVGNLHLSLADWQPAQKVFDSLLVKKVTNVDAYASLSLGNIYFATLHVSEKRYAKHLQYASDYYKRILAKDPANAYAGNGLGTVLAEKAEIFKAKEVFNRVREVSGDSLADALVNLGHIYLAQKKHPEALQMYMNYMKRAEDGTTPITSKSRVDDVVEVLLYIAFAYFDWARHTELFNDANAAPADGRYQQAMDYLNKAVEKHSKRDIVLKYNLCMTKLQAANCILQKLTRNIPRTVDEVQGALDGLNESLKVVEDFVKQKSEGKKVQISSSTLQDFLKHCRDNISAAESHLDDEKKRAEEAKQEKEIRRLAAEAARQEEDIRKALEQEKIVREQEERDKKAEAKMRQVEEMQQGWKQEQELEAQRKAQQKKKAKPGEDDFLVDDAPPGQVEEEKEENKRHGLFDDSDDEDEDNEQQTTPTPTEAKKVNATDIFGDSDDSDDEDGNADAGAKETSEAPKNVSAKDVFGDSDDDSSDDENAKASSVDKAADKDKSEEKSKSNEELFEDSSDDGDSDEELVAPAKRDAAEGPADEGPAKKRRVLEEDN